MPREFTVSVDCAMSAASMWSLRSDTGFDDYFARLDKQVYSLSKNERTKDSDGLCRVDREFALCFDENPLPKYLRALVPKGVDTDTPFRVVCNFCPDRWDAGHPYEYTTIFPILSDRISVKGKQWLVERSPSACRLCARVTISVVLGPLSWSCEKAIESSMRCMLPPSPPPAFASVDAPSAFRCMLACTRSCDHARRLSMRLQRGLSVHASACGGLRVIAAPKGGRPAAIGTVVCTGDVERGPRPSRDECSRDRWCARRARRHDGSRERGASYLRGAPLGDSLGMGAEGHAPERDAPARPRPSSTRRRVDRQAGGGSGGRGALPCTERDHQTRRGCARCGAL